MNVGRCRRADFNDQLVVHGFEIGYSGTARFADEVNGAELEGAHGDFRAGMCQAGEHDDWHWVEGQQLLEEFEP